MSLPHALLGFLREEPLTGYDLKTQCFDKSVAHFWPADQAQIYRTLEKMVAQGWVSSHLEVQHNRPNRKVYTLTPAGETALYRWLVQPQGLPTHRDPLLIQVFFADQLSDPELLNLLTRQLTAHQELLDYYQDMPNHLPLPPLDDPTASREERMHRLVLEMAMGKEQSYIRWLQQAIALIQTASV
ncbi:PadR family transcriptional regulator [Anthocerotibacter panamensis]|uniref:PadR family transcriptional regulator n=1 Tax=Anthocerotibacter panamensis TaxID=2857077 RepID=UPI001C402B1C|nr:PadR family transcriptional regulator [Anthocerotibacter panamensis]